MTMVEKEVKVLTANHIIRRGPSADGLWAEFRIGGTVGFAAVKEGEATADACLHVSVRIMKLRNSAYRDRFFFEAELVALGKEGDQLTEVNGSGFHVVGCYEISSQTGWIQAKRGSISL